MSAHEVVSMIVRGAAHSQPCLCILMTDGLLLFVLSRSSVSPPEKHSPCAPSDNMWSAVGRRSMGMTVECDRSGKELVRRNWDGSVAVTLELHRNLCGTT